MADRNEIQKDLEQKLAKGETALNKLKAKMEEAGDDASQEMKDAVAAAERTLDKGKGRLDAMAKATDEEFEKMWADTKDAWHDMSASVEHGWHKLSDRVKSFFA